MSLWLSCILTWTLTWIQTNVHVHKQTNNKQINTHVWAFKKRNSNHLISQNVHHINHNNHINKWSGAWGLICMDFHAYCHRDLWFHQCSLISMTWSGLSIGWTTEEPAAPPGTVSSCCWWADQLRTKDITPHKRTRSLLTLHHDHWCSFCSFSIETLSHILKYCPFPDGIIITSMVSF